MRDWPSHPFVIVLRCTSRVLASLQSFIQRGWGNLLPYKYTFTTLEIGTDVVPKNTVTCQYFICINVCSI